jgi:hypothetical protein
VLEGAVCSDRLMELARKHETQPLHPFGGCNRLMGQYQVIGQALLYYEDHSSSRFILNRQSSREFSVGVSFVPVEVLETYLDDLLDLTVGDDTLCIKRSSSMLKKVVAFLAVVGVGLIQLESWLSLSLMSIVLLSTLIIGLLCVAFALPRMRVVRRFSFATLVSREIATRRGQGHSGLRSFAGRMLMGDLWSIEKYSPSSYSAHSHSRYIH